MEPLERVLVWKPYLRSNMLDQLLEAEFFPKWLDTLYVWLSSGSTDYDQVTQWYTWWKSWFDEEISRLPGMKHGFGKGLELMNNALTLGEDAQFRYFHSHSEILYQANSVCQIAKTILSTYRSDSLRRGRSTQVVQSSSTRSVRSQLPKRRGRDCGREQSHLHADGPFASSHWSTVVPPV